MCAATPALCLLVWFCWWFTNWIGNKFGRRFEQQNNPLVNCLVSCMCRSTPHVMINYRQQNTKRMSTKYILRKSMQHNREKLSSRTKKSVLINDITKQRWANMERLEMIEWSAAVVSNFSSNTPWCSAKAGKLLCECTINREKNQDNIRLCWPVWERVGGDCDCVFLAISLPSKQIQLHVW